MKTIENECSQFPITGHDKPKISLKKLLNRSKQRNHKAAPKLNLKYFLENGA